MVCDGLNIAATGSRMHRTISIQISPSQTKRVNDSVILIGEVRNSLNRNKGNAFLRIEMSTQDARIIFGRKLSFPREKHAQFDYSRPSAHKFGCSFEKKRIKELKGLFAIGEKNRILDEIPSSVARIRNDGSRYTLYMIGRHAVDVGPLIAYHAGASKIDDDEVAVTFGKQTLAEILRA